MTGEMDPRWAFVTFDSAQMDMSVSSSNLAGSGQATLHKLEQIELEVGPSVEMIIPANKVLQQLDDQLRPLVESIKPVYGRKIHRLLEDYDEPIGSDLPKAHGV